MLDEPSAGLSPVLVDRVLAAASQLRESGTAILLVEQLIEKSLAVADRAYAMVGGTIVLEASSDEPDLPQRLERIYFGPRPIEGDRTGLDSASLSGAF
jgi:branched-chain amino acid transport system ATP-binding protein